MKVHYKPLKIKFGLGGVIVKERRQFESKISELVESDVIHHKAIDQELRKPEFDQILKTVVADLFTDHLPTVIPPELSLAQIPCAENSFLELKKDLLMHLQKLAPEVMPQILQDTHIEEFISENQLEYLSNNLSGLLQSFIKDKTPLQPILNDLIKGLSPLKINEIVTEQLIAALEVSTPALFDDFHENLRYNYANQIDTLVEQSKKNLEIDQLLDNIAHQVAQKRLYEVFSARNVENVPKAVLENIQNLFQSDISADIIQTLLKFILNVLQEEKATVFELLSDDLKGNFESFLENKLPDMLNTLVPWIRQKKFRLEQLIQDSFKDNTSSFGQLLVSVFLGNVGKYVGVEEKLIELIEKQDIKDLSSRASEYILDYLKNNTIGDIIRRFDQEKILANLTPVLKEQINQSFDKVSVSDIDNIFDKPVANWFSEKRLKNALSDLVDTVIENEGKNKWLFTHHLDEFIQNRVQKEFQKIKTAHLGDWIPEEKQASFAKNLESTLHKLLEDNQDNISDFIQQNIHQYIQGKNIQQIIPAKDIDWEKLIQNNLNVFLDKQFNNIKDQEVRNYLQDLAQSKSLDQQISQAIKKYLLENLPNLMKGRIETLVKENLAKQPDTKLRDMVYKAMGEELRPLSLFGGILGTITGFLLLAMPDFQGLGALMLVSGAAYGITGWSTNWLAIKMLFRPYRPIKLFGGKYNLPFTPGVIAKHKARFAKSMGRFIGDRLLNQENLQENFSKNQPRLEQNFKDLFSKDDYAFISTLIDQNRKTLSKEFAKFVQNQYLNQNSALKQSVSEWIARQGDWKPGSLVGESFEQKVQDFLNAPDIQERLQKLIYQRLEKWLALNSTLKEALPKSVIRQLLSALEPWVMEELRKFEQKIEANDILELANFEFLEEKIDEFIQKNLLEILNDEQEEKLKNQVFEFIQSKIQSDAVKQRIFSFIDDKLSDEFAPSKNIKDFFGGRLLELIENNLNQILERIIQMAVEWMQKNKDDIAETVYNQALAQNTLAWTYRNSIIGTTRDLVDKGIPNFLRTEFQSLQKMIHTKVHELGESPFNTNNFIALDKDNIKRHIDRILENPKLLRKTRQLTNLILEERIFKIPLNALIQDDSHALVKHLKTVLHPEIETIQNHLKGLVDDEVRLRATARPVANLLIQILRRNFLNVHTSTLLKGVQPSDLQDLSHKLTHILVHSSAFREAQKMLSTNLKEEVHHYSLSDLVSAESLGDDIGSLLDKKLQDPDFQSIINQNLETLSFELMAHVSEDIRPETKQFIIETASRAIFGTLQKNILGLINALDFKGIVVREIENMHAKELEDLFYGFARKYFKYLIGYGFIFGIIFGLAIDYGLLSLLNIF